MRLAAKQPISVAAGNGQEQLWPVGGGLIAARPPHPGDHAATKVRPGRRKKTQRACRGGQFLGTYWGLRRQALSSRLSHPPRRRHSRQALALQYRLNGLPGCLVAQ